METVQKHLSLLRLEHVQLQESHATLQREHECLLAAYKLIAAEDDSALQSFTKKHTSTTGGGGSDSFVLRLVETVSDLFEKDLYSDIVIHLDGHQLRAHRFVLTARSQCWGHDLATVDRLDFTDVSYNIGHTMLKWIYTDKLDTKLGDTFLLDLMKCAQQFSLNQLVQRCESILIGRLDIGNSIAIYQTADRLQATRLRQASSALITARWSDFSRADFDSMCAQLLYGMLKTHDQYPLHAAIRLHREDVVFLYLIEHNANLLDKLSIVDGSGQVALSVALSEHQTNVCEQLVLHAADVNATDSNGTTLLYTAVTNGDVSSAEFLLSHEANVGMKCTANGDTVLHALARLKADTNGNEKSLDRRPGDCVRAFCDLLISHKHIDLNAQDKHGRTALHTAITQGNRLLVDKLLDGTHQSEAEGLNVNVRDKSGASAFSMALALYKQGDTQGETLLEMLVLAGAELDQQDTKGDNLLQLHLEHIHRVLFLLKHAIDVNARNNKGESALHSACALGCSDVIRPLVLAGCVVNECTVDTVVTDDDPFAVGRQTPLHMAIANQHIATAHVLLDIAEKQLDFCVRDSNGDTPLALALATQNIKLCERLVQAGANVNEANSLLLRCITDGNSEAALFLIASGVQLTQRTSDGHSCLWLSCTKDMSTVVRALCAAGVDINEPDIQGDCPLWTALTLGYMSCASELCASGCDTDVWSVAHGLQDCEQTMLHRAIDSNLQHVACFLINNGCSLNVPRRAVNTNNNEHKTKHLVCEEARDAQTPLHLAAAWGQLQVVQALIQQGADLNVQDCNGQCALHVAVLNHEQAILNSLLGAPSICVSVRDKRNVTPLATAMHSHNNTAAQAIMDTDRAAAMQFDSSGHNLLHSAVKQSDLENVLFLLGVQLDVNVRTQDNLHNTALHLAAQTGHEMILRNLIVAGADVDTLNARKQSALMLAAMNEHPLLCSILLEHMHDCTTLDANCMNALHLAVQAGSVACVRTLLNESNIDAHAVNTKGYTCAHILACHGKESAPVILQTIADADPSFPFDRLDQDGNTAVLLAYMNGQSQLCRAMLRLGVCVAQSNQNGVNIFNYQTPTKQLLFKLLDELSAEPHWADGDFCSECGNKFSLTTRKHHCRHCGRQLCAKCTKREMPILKYDLQKPVRVCEVCADLLTMGTEQ